MCVFSQSQRASDRFFVFWLMMELLRFALSRPPLKEVRLVVKQYHPPVPARFPAFTTAKIREVVDRGDITSGEGGVEIAKLDDSQLKQNQQPPIPRVEPMIRRTGVTVHLPRPGRDQDHGLWTGLFHVINGLASSSLPVASPSQIAAFPGCTPPGLARSWIVR